LEENEMGKIAIAALILIGSAIPSIAAESCADKNKIVNNLAERYGEIVQMTRSVEGGVLMGFSSFTAGTWTILLAKPDGSACYIDSGHLQKIKKDDVGA
jgi:hypothetical protein